MKKNAWEGEREEDGKEGRVKGRVEWRVEGKKDRRKGRRVEGRNTFSSSFLAKCLWLEIHPAAHLAIKSHLVSKYS